MSRKMAQLLFKLTIIYLHKYLNNFPVLSLVPTHPYINYPSYTSHILSTLPPLSLLTTLDSACHACPILFLAFVDVLSGG